LVISHGANSTRTDRPRFRIEFDYIGTWDLSGYLCVPECIRFLSALVPGGLAGLMKHNHDRALEGRDVLLEALAPLTGQTVPPVHDRMLGSMAALMLPDPPRGVIRPSTLGYHDALWDDLIQRHGIQVPVFPFPSARPGAKYDDVNPQKRLIRIAMQAYNSVEQVRYLAGCLREELERER
jgi:isopenicillin-N epimerase